MAHLRCQARPPSRTQSRSASFRDPPARPRDASFTSPRSARRWQFGWAVTPAGWTTAGRTGNHGEWGCAKRGRCGVFADFPSPRVLGLRKTHPPTRSSLFPYIRFGCILTRLATFHFFCLLWGGIDFFGHWWPRHTPRRSCPNERTRIRAADFNSTNARGAMPRRHHFPE